MKDPQYIITFMSMIRSKAHNLIMSEFKKNDIEGLAPSHAAILNLLYRTGDKLKMNDIAEKIGRDKSTLTVLINKLARLKYVKRVKSKDDSRSTYIVLTQKGLDLKPIFTQIADLMIETAFRNFTDKEKYLLMEKLDKLYNNYI